MGSNMRDPLRQDDQLEATVEVFKQMIRCKKELWMRENILLSRLHSFVPHTGKYRRILSKPWTCFLLLHSTCLNMHFMRKFLPSKKLCLWVLSSFWEVFTISQEITRPIYNFMCVSMYSKIAVWHLLITSFYAN